MVTKLLVWQIALLGRLHYSSAFVLLHLNYSSNCHLWMAAETCIAIPQLFAVIYSSDLNNTYMLCIAVSIDFSPLLRPLTPVFLSFAVMQKCHVKNKDIRKFLDGIYVSDKGAIKEE